MAVPGGVFSFSKYITNFSSGAADRWVWVMRAGTTKKIWIRHVKLTGTFTGTSAATESNIALAKFALATIPVGGTAYVPTAHSSRWATATTVPAAYLKWVAAGMTGIANTEIKGDAIYVMTIPSIAPNVATITTSGGYPSNALSTQHEGVVWEREFYRRDIKNPQYWRDELELAPGTQTTGTGTAEGLGLLALGTPVANANIKIDITWEEEA